MSTSACAPGPEELTSSVTVSVRVRPLSQKESEASATGWLSGNCVACTRVPAAKGKDTITVYSKGRPANSADADAELSDASTVKLQRANVSHSFTFDTVFPPSAQQEELYSTLGQPMLEAALGGFNTCLFAYGQTGSGKSYSMMGPDGGLSAEDAPGVTPRLCDGLFARLADLTRGNAEEVAAAKAAGASLSATPPELDVSVFVSYLEIYNEKVRCLLSSSSPAAAGASDGARRAARAPSPDGLRVRNHPQHGVYVEGLRSVRVTSAGQMLQLMKRGNRERHMASTLMNDSSSRSHSIFTIQVVQRRRGMYDAEEKEGAESEGGSAGGGGVGIRVTERQSKIHLVDLAGSERARSTGGEGEVLKQASQINKSLTTLGIVINALADISSQPGARRRKKDTHVPYRDSTLTFLLKESLGGNSRTFMLSTVSPSTRYYDETLSTLRYADRAKAIVTHAVVNETADDRRIRELETEVASLRQTILRLQSDLRSHHTLGQELGGAGRDAAASVSASDDASDDGAESLAERLRQAEALVRQLTASGAHLGAEPLSLHQQPPPQQRQPVMVALQRAEPYLLNLSAVGGWAVAHLSAEVTAITPACAEDDSSSDDEHQQRIAIAPEYAEGLGAPHCFLRRTAGGQVRLCPCAGYTTYVNGSPASADGLVLRSGDEISVGAAGLAFQFTDPSTPPPPRTARGERGTASVTPERAATAAAAASPSLFSAVEGSPELADADTYDTSLDFGSRGGAATETEEEGEDGEEEEEEEGTPSAVASDATDASADVVEASPPIPPHQQGLERVGVPALNFSSLLKKPMSMPHTDASFPTNAAAATSVTSQTAHSPPAMTSTAPAVADGTHRLGHAGGVGGRRAAAAAAARTVGIVEPPSVHHDAADDDQGSDVFAAIQAELSEAQRAVFDASLVRLRRAHAEGAADQGAATAFVGRQSVVFIGAQASGKTALQHNLAQPDKWYSFLLPPAGGGPPSVYSPTLGVRKQVLELRGDDIQDLKLLCLEVGGGMSGVAALHTQLPSRRVSYALCFSLVVPAAGPGGSRLRPVEASEVFSANRGFLELILCRSDNRDVGLLLFGTRLDEWEKAVKERGAGGNRGGGGGGLTSPPQQQELKALLTDLEVMVQTFFQSLQSYVALRPTIAGSFAVDNASRRLVHAGTPSVGNFPQLLAFLRERAVQGCRNDLDFPRGLIPLRCVELSKQLTAYSLLLHGSPVLSAADYKAFVCFLYSKYYGLSPDATRRELHADTQLMATWGVLQHAFRNSLLRQEILLDVRWGWNVLAAVSLCAGFRAREAVASLPFSPTSSSSSSALLTSPQSPSLSASTESARYDEYWRSIYSSGDVQQVLPEAQTLLQLDRFALLPLGIMTTSVLSALSSSLMRGAAAKKDPETRLGALLDILRKHDMTIRGSRVLVSHLQDDPSTLPTELLRLRGEESFVVFPSSFTGTPSRSIVEQLPKLLTGPFYRFRFNMVPLNLFPKLLARLANNDVLLELDPDGSESSACPQADGVESRDRGGGVYVGPVTARQVPSDASSQFPAFLDARYHGEGPARLFPTRTYIPQPAAPGETFWRNAAWVASRRSGSRALLRMMPHALFITFHCVRPHHEYELDEDDNSDDENGDEEDERDSVGVKEHEQLRFYEQLLHLVRQVVRESPGASCEESVLSAANFETLLRHYIVDHSLTALEEDIQEAEGAGGQGLFYSPVDADINSLEKIRARERFTVQTARTSRLLQNPFDRAAAGAAGATTAAAAVTVMRDDREPLPDDADFARALLGRVCERRERHLTELLRRYNAAATARRRDACESAAVLDAIMDTMARAFNN